MLGVLVTTFSVSMSTLFLVTIGYQKQQSFGTAGGDQLDNNVKAINKPMATISI